MASKVTHDREQKVMGSLSPSEAAGSPGGGLNPTPERILDLEGLALLRQIFPDEEIGDLKKLHEQRLLNAAGQRNKLELDAIDAQSSSTNRCKHGYAVTLPDDFLRLPPELAVRRYNAVMNKWEYQLVQALQSRALIQHRRFFKRTSSKHQFYTVVLDRDPTHGLGMTLVENSGWVRIYGVSHVTRSKEGERNGSDMKVETGDCLVGVNGYALFEIALTRHSMLRQTVAFLKTCPSPVVLHLQKMTPKMKLVFSPPSTPSVASSYSLLDQTIDESFESDQSYPVGRDPKPQHLHPFSRLLADRGIITKADQINVTDTLQQLTERARQWEFSNSFRIESRARSYQLSPAVDACGDSAHNSPLSNPPSRYSFPGWKATMPNEYTKAASDIFIPLMGVRKGLSVRILNAFLDGESTAYTIWVHDIESSREWYAPLRYLCDFHDLRAATLNLRPAIAQIPFPSPGWSLFASPSREASETDDVRESKCRQLEHFLRALCTMIYLEDLHPAVAEVAIHAQSFLGCDSVLDDTSIGLNSHQHHFQAVDAPLEVSAIFEGFKHSEEQLRARMQLKKSIQMYSYRVFLLPSIQKLVNQFVDTARANGPTLRDIEILQAGGRNTLKKRAMEELQKIQKVINQIESMLLEGCMDDFRGIARSSAFSELHHFVFGSSAESYWDRLVREAVREQVEIEVYVPLRGTASRLLVNAWRHEDMAVSFKLQELRKRPMDCFKLSLEKNNLSSWDSVAGLLKKVSLSTLPCAKLRAIVDAASEISRLYLQSKIKTQVTDYVASASDEKTNKHLSADDFLPIFIFCVIRAEMERPCALCVLLRTLCDPINRLGEVGYYLASFEAAVAHIREIDLSESREEMFSFLSISLSEGSSD